MGIMSDEMRFFTRRFGIAPQLIIPFVVISLLSTLLLGASCLWTLNRELSVSQEKKAELLTRDLATEPGRPLFRGEYERLNEILESVLIKWDEMAVYGNVDNYRTSGSSTVG